MAKSYRRTTSTSIEQHDLVIPSLNDQIIDTQELRSDGQPNSEGSEGVKTKGRGKGKGIKGHGMTIEVHDNMIITIEAIRNLGVLFKQSIKCPWVTYIEYPKEDLDTLYARFKSNFNYTCSEEVLRAAFNEHVRIRYPEWMLSIRQSVFKEFKTNAKRYTNGPDHILVTTWKKVRETKKKSRYERHSSSHYKFCSNAKYRKEELDCYVQLDRNGIEPSPFEFFKKFHSYKEGNWASEKAEKMHKKMDSNKPPPETENARAKEWEIYREVTGKPKHDRVLGLGTGLKPSDVFTSSISTNCGKRICLER
ncbi:hypothetical protein Dsin_009411 [Dipteronia sinensis]|uniref:Transposase, Ptta/En/Spm, plant n=1 Tax=Dipteronia sinensis TaxID=43782 RepID=A0AAE0AQH8_9ROSI|nr:hypothetical protein Dsin_009411 [Dipteronia sinensis]